MNPVILDGKKTAQKILKNLEAEIAHLQPKLAVVLVGENPASLAYVAQKRKACAQAGVNYEEIHFPASISYTHLLEQIEKLNKDSSVNGYIIQLPLPDHLQDKVPEIIKHIDPYKDVDGFHAYNLGKMFTDKEFEDMPPATPLGIIKLLEEYQLDVQGKEVVVVGHSNIVGKPISTMLLNRNATVTTCHIHTKNLSFHTSRADILIVGVGKPDLITENMVKDSAVVIDVGFNQVPSATSKHGFTLVGDVDFENVSKKASYITPVPGGIGPMTVAALILNTVRATQKQHERH